MASTGPRTLEPVGVTLGLASLVDLQELDTSGALMELASVELAYRIGIVATSRVVQPSLASFLR
jgi:hypothetical protein